MHADHCSALSEPRPEDGRSPFVVLKKMNKMPDQSHILLAEAAVWLEADYISLRGIVVHWISPAKRLDAAIRTHGYAFAHGVTKRIKQCVREHHLFKGV